MKYENKRGIAPLAIIALLFIALVGITVGTSSGLLSIGGSVLSVDQVEFDESGEKWIVTILGDGSSESLYGQFSQSEITDGDLSSENDFTLGIEISKQQFKYPLTTISSATPIYKYEIVKQGSRLFVSCDDGQENWKTLTTDYCLEKTNIGNIHRLNNPEISQAVSVEIRSGGKVAKKVVNYDEPNVDLDNHGDIRLLGGLWTGKAQPNAQNYYAVLDQRSDEYVLVDKNYYENVYLAKVNQFTLGNVLSGNINTFVDGINQAADVVMRGEKISDEAGSQIVSQTERNGFYIVEIQEPVVNPLLRLTLDADFIGVKRSSGIPEILSATGSTFDAGTTGLITTIIKNKGNDVGSFKVSATCEDGLQSENPNSLSLRPGESTEVNLVLKGTQLENDANLDCDVKVTDVNDPSISDSASVEINLNRQQFCEQKVFVDGNRVLKYDATCNVEVIKDCGDAPVEFKDGQYSCLSLPEIPATLQEQIDQCRADGGEWKWESTSSSGFLGDSESIGGSCKQINFIWWAFLLFIIFLVGAIAAIIYLPLPIIIVPSAIMTVIMFIVWVLGLMGVL